MTPRLFPATCRISLILWLWASAALAQVQEPSPRLASAMFVTNFTDNLNNGKDWLNGWVFDPNDSASGITHPIAWDIGTNDFSVWVRVRVPEITAYDPIGLFELKGASGNVFNAALDVLGYLSVSIVDSGGDNRSYSLSGFGGVLSTGVRGKYSAKVTDLIVTRLGGVVQLWVNGATPSVTEAANGTPPDWADAITTTSFIIGREGTFPWQDVIHAAGLWNRALSAEDIARLRENGVSRGDQWGSPTAIIHHSSAVLNGGFENLGGGGADVFASWSENTSGSSTVNSETGSPYAGSRTCRLDVDASDSSVGVTASSVMTPGRRYRVAYTAKRGATAGSLTVTGVSTDTSWTNALTTSYTRYTRDFMAGGSNFKFVRAVGSASASLYIDNVELHAIGAVVAPDLQTGIGSYIPDLTTNRWNGDIAGLVRPLQLARSGERVVQRTFLHSEISTSAGTTLLLSLPANCGILDVEWDREYAFDGGATLDVGTSGSAARYVSAAVATSTGKLLSDSLAKASESTTSATLVYIKKSASTTVGQTTVRVRYVIRGN